MSDTIAAIATGNLVSAIGIIRMSGDDAIAIADKVFSAQCGVKMREAEDRKLYFGEVKSAEGAVLDICLCTVSRGPKSYTGEDTAEFQCHGSPTVLGEILKTLFSAGARQATAGEFTKRAFLNGRMDLSQAEAVIDLIDAETVSAARNAAGQLGRAISRKTDEIYEDLTDILSHFHAVLDYPDEDIEDFSLAGYVDVLDRSIEKLTRLLDTVDRGKILKEGIRCAIVGRPNTGKSSLLNTLLGYDRAIVTDIAGTTRDVIEEKVRLGDLILRLIDTAGIRDTEDTVEKIGVTRAENAAKEAQLVLAVFDGAAPLNADDRGLLQRLNGRERVIAVVNKSDLPQKADLEEIRRHIPCICVLSAKMGEGIEVLADAVCAQFPMKEVPAGEILSNARQAEAAARARDSLISAKEALFAGVTPDAVLTEVEAAMAALGEITGRTVREDITARIFARFCVGK